MLNRSFHSGVCGMSFAKPERGNYLANRQQPVLCELARACESLESLHDGAYGHDGVYVLLSR